MKNIRLMFKGYSILFLTLIAQQLQSQTLKDTLIDLGYGLYENFSNEDLVALKQNNIFCVNYIANNSIAFKNPDYTETVTKSFNDDFIIKKEVLKIVGIKNAIQTVIEQDTNLHSYYTFCLNNDFYQYFVFLHVNAGGNINKLYTALLVKNKTIIIPLPNEISSTNPAILFSGKDNPNLLTNSLCLLDFRMDYYDKVSLYILANDTFVKKEDYHLTLARNITDYPAQIDTTKSNWFFTWNK